MNKMINEHTVLSLLSFFCFVVITYRMNEVHQKELAVCGFEAVRALSCEHPEKISRFFFAESRMRSFGSLCKYLAQRKRLYRLVKSDMELERLCGSVHHQGVVAMIEVPRIATVTKDLIRCWEHDKTEILLCDRIGNANNLGAIIRSAAFFGIEHIVISGEDAQAQLTPSAYRIAQGGMEFVTLYTTNSAEYFLTLCSTACNGALLKIGTDHRAYRSLQDMPSLVDQKQAVVIVLGNEEHGISAEAKKLCDVLVKIRGDGAIESLNVAQAATLFCASLFSLRQLPSTV